MRILDRAFPNHINLTHVFAYFFPAFFKRRFLNPVLSSRNPVLSGQRTCPAGALPFSNEFCILALSEHPAFRD